MIQNFSVEEMTARLRRENVRDTEERMVIMGNGLGRNPIGNLYALNPDGSTSQYLWVRDIGSVGEGLYGTSGLPYRVLPGIGPSPEIDKVVWITWENGPRKYRVHMSDPDHMTETGRSMHLENPTDPHNQFHSTEQLMPLRAQWIGDMKISVQGWQYRDADGTYRAYPGTSAMEDALSHHVDGAELVPNDPAMHSYVLIAYDTGYFASGMDPIRFYASFPQDWFTPLDDTDIQECYDQMGEGVIEIWLFRIATGDTDNRGHSDDRDVRPWINTPLNTGMTSFIVTGDSGPSQTIEDGNTLHVLGGTNLTSVASATDTITLNHDASGISAGAVAYPASITFDAQGHASAATPGSAPIVSLALAGDTGTPQTLSNGDTLSVLTGAKLTSTASATDTITITHDTSGISAGTFTNPSSITFDSTGHATAATSGSAPGTMSSFTVSGDSGTPQSITDGNTLLISGGVGLSSVASATDTVTVNLDNTAVTPATYTNATVTFDAQGRATSAANGTAPVTSVGATAPIASSGGTTPTISLNDTAVTPGPYTNPTFTVDQKGRITAASNGTVTPTPTDLLVTWGETITVRSLVFRKLSDNKWYKTDSDASPILMSHERGIVSDAGTGVVNTTGYVRILGYMAGFSGLTAGGTIYASTTAGGLTQTEPTVTLDGATMMIAPFGYAISTTEILVDTREPIIYRQYLTSDDGEITSITHHDNVPSLSRQTAIRTMLYDTLLAETYASSNQDASIDLRGPSGAGSVNVIDTTGASVFTLGDSAGTDYRIAQSFQVTAAGTFNAFSVRFGTITGTPTVAPTWSLQADSASKPSGVSLISGVMSAITPSADNGVTGIAGPFLNTGVTYWLVLSLSAMQATNNYYAILRTTTNVYANGTFLADSTTGASFPGTWSFVAAGTDLRCSVTVAALVTTDAIAQGTSHSSGIVVPSVRLWLRKVGSATGTLTCAIYSDSSGSPNTVITNGTAATISASTLSTSYAYIDFTWVITARPSLSASTQYHIVLTTSASTDSTNYVQWGSDNTSPSYANGQAKTLISSAWAATSPASDAVFELYQQSTAFEENLTPGIWDSTDGNGQIAIRYGDSGGANKATITRFRNVGGESILAIFDVIER